MSQLYERAWPELRAVLVLLHVVAVVLVATPSPSVGLRRSTWADPTVQAEFAAWNERFHALGAQWTEKEMEDRLWSFATSYNTVREEILLPFNPYTKYLGTSQTWRMFVAPQRFPTRLDIDVEENGAWTPVFEERSPTLTWLRPMMDHDRVRSVIFRFGWAPYKHLYEDFGTWIAARAARDFPDATRVRLHLYRYQTPSPEQVLTHTEPEGAWQQEHILSLTKLHGNPELAP